MHIVFVENMTHCCDSGTDTIDKLSLIVDMVSLITTILLGVVTIIIGRYIYQKRRDAEYGFYINLKVYIERLKPFLYDGEFSGVTDYLCIETIRDTTLVKDKAKTAIDLYVPLCRDFLTLISNADNNIPPKNKRRKKHSKKRRPKIGMTT